MVLKSFNSNGYKFMKIMSFEDMAEKMSLI